MVRTASASHYSTTHVDFLSVHATHVHLERCRSDCPSCTSALELSYIKIEPKADEARQSFLASFLWLDTATDMIKNGYVTSSSSLQQHRLHFSVPEEKLVLTCFI